ncbi:MAG: MFS transporter [Acidobacteria bacterium]|nr:MFS transporter [Acidobacteriota bacterium]
MTAGILGALYLAAMESTVVTTAMPTIITRLGGLEIYSWVFSIYLLTSTVSIPVWGRLSDLHGRRRLYLAGLGLFAIGSLLCGLSTGMPQLIVFRGVQGLGAGALVPLALTIIGEIYTFDERARMQAVFSGVWGFASITGPLIGGFITDNFSWRWVFFINIPVGLIAATIIEIYLVERVPEGLGGRAGIRRGILMSLAIALFLLYLMEGGQNNRWLDGRVIAFLLSSALLFLLYLRLEKKSERPFIPPELFRHKMFVAASVNGVCIGMIFFGVIAFVPLFAQAVLGRSATEAGSAITPVLLTWVCSSVIMGRLWRHVGFRRPVFCGMALLVLGTAMVVRLGGTASRSSMILSMICIGAGMGLNALPMLMAVQSTVPRDFFGIATSATQFFRNIGGAVGVAIMGSRLSSVLWRALHQRPDPELVKLFQHPEVLLDARSSVSATTLMVFRDTVAAGLQNAFFMVFMFSLFAFLSAFLVPKEGRRAIDGF